MPSHNAKPTIIYRNADGKFVTEEAQLSETPDGSLSVVIPPDSEGEFEFIMSKTAAEHIAKIRNNIRRIN